MARVFDIVRKSQELETLLDEFNGIVYKASDLRNARKLSRKLTHRISKISPSMITLDQSLKILDLALDLRRFISEMYLDSVNQEVQDIRTVEELHALCTYCEELYKELNNRLDNFVWYNEKRMKNMKRIKR